MCPNSSRYLWILKMSVLFLALGIVLFMFRSVSLYSEFSIYKAPLLQPSVAAGMLKLLPEKHIKSLFTHDGIWLFPKNQCKCEAWKLQQSYYFENAYGQTELPAVKMRRQAEFEHFQRREGLPRPPPLLAQANLPFGYPIHGVEVMPLNTIPIPGVQFEGPDAPIYKARVTLKASLGTLNTLADTPDTVVQGRGQKELTILTSSRTVLNFILQHVTYTSTEYQHPRVDVETLRTTQVKTVRLPKDRTLMSTLSCSERKLRNLVSIATKTFLRPHKLKTMLRSIREYYPDLTVIVADDSKEPLEINDSHVEYYTMPYGKYVPPGNLAISQVTTKYVLWVDDDFLFNEKTKIEVLVDVLEKTELDVVGGSVLGNTFQFKLFLEHTKNGDCLHRRTGSFGPLDGFPNCVVTSGVVNFFLAHTERLQRVGFDPRLQRVAHSEFFIDGLGSLLVGSCSDVIIGHQPHSSVADPELAALEKTYGRYRANTNDKVQFKLALHYFKNHL
uniref:Glycosyltransferase 2-like domain-containing protein n=1 Tax=Capra hircus TaxID=9925 RepID=A0A8C2SI73_CAPHI